MNFGHAGLRRRSRRWRSRCRRSASRWAPCSAACRSTGSRSVRRAISPRHVLHQGDHNRPGDRRGGQLDRLRASARSGDRYRARGPVQPLRRAVLAVHAPRLPRALRRRRRAVHLPVPRRRSTTSAAWFAGGPPVRPLDRFYTRLNTSTGLVEIGPRLLGQLELQRFSARDPGQPLDGIGQYLYPARFDTSILPKRLVPATVARHAQASRTTTAQGFSSRCPSAPARTARR